MSTIHHPDPNLGTEDLHGARRLETQTREEKGFCCDKDGEGRGSVPRTGRRRHSERDRGASVGTNRNRDDRTMDNK